MPRWKPSLPNIPAAIQRYGLAVLSVAIALGIGLLLERYHFRDVEFPLFLFAIVVNRLVRRGRAWDSCGRTFQLSLRLLLH